MKTHMTNEKNKTERRLSFETTLPCPAEEVWKIYEKPSGWLEHLNPQAKLIPAKQNRSIEQWQIDENYTFHLFMYGFVPFGKHHIAFETIDPENFKIQSREHGFMVPHWDNYFEVKPLTDSTCTIKDVLVIESNGINGIVASYAIGVFKAKHKKLLKRFQ